MASSILEATLFVECNLPVRKRCLWARRQCERALPGFAHKVHLLAVLMALVEAEFIPLDHES